MTWPCSKIGSEFDCWYRDGEVDLGPIIVEIDHKLFFIVILLLPMVQEEVSQLQAKVCAESTA